MKIKIASQILFTFCLSFLLIDIAYAYDEFDYPVGAPSGSGYHHSAFLEPRDGGIYHPAEDWNGDGGGDSDLGDNVYAIADGTVVAADDYGAMWGNIILIQHTLEDSSTIWSQYAHLQDINVSVNDTVSKGDIIGTIGKGDDNRYLAHLHLEIRYQYREPDAWVTGWSIQDIQDYYYEPSDFISHNRTVQTISQTINSTDSLTVVGQNPHYQQITGVGGRIRSITVNGRWNGVSFAPDVEMTLNGPYPAQYFADSYINFANTSNANKQFTFDNTTAVFDSGDTWYIYLAMPGAYGSVGLIMAGSSSDVLANSAASDTYKGSVQDYYLDIEYQPIQ
jgi:murein DD-endopeptidase MepM/ murein hydrolase activator NlpD